MVTRSPRTSATRSSSRFASLPKWSWSSRGRGRQSSPSRSHRMIPRCESPTSLEPGPCLAGSRRCHCVRAWCERSNISAACLEPSAWRSGHPWLHGAGLEASPDLMTLAKERFSVRDYHGAALLLSSLTQEGPAFADALNLLGLSLALVDRADDAVGAFDQALRVNPRYVEAYLNRAVVLNHLGREQEAQTSMSRAAELGAADESGYPAVVANKLANAHLSLGHDYRAAGALELAIAQYRRALELRPQFN